jgi:hypothetical protein
MRTDGLFYNEWVYAFGNNPEPIEGFIYEEWIMKVAKAFCSNFDRSSVDDVPHEFRNLFMNPARESINVLCLRILGEEPVLIGIGQVRIIVEFVLDYCCEYKISPKDYSSWISQLIVICEADMSKGAIRRELFISRFYIWFASRSWKAWRNIPPIEDIITSWKFVDVGDSGVLSMSSMKNHLLPYAFRVMFPESSADDSELKSKWIQIMMPVFNGTRSQWINHWREFSKLDFKRFITIVSEVEDRKTLAMEGMDFLEVDCDDKYIADLGDLMTSIELTKIRKARVFCLWLVSIRHNHYVYKPVNVLEERIPNKPSITSVAEFRDYCLFMWTGGASISPAEGQHFDKWMNSMIEICSISKNRTREFLALRSDLVGRFLTADEVNTIWRRFIGESTDRLVPSDLRHILRGVYTMKSFNGFNAGEWIIEKWYQQLMTYVRARYSIPGKPLYVTRMAFSWALPLVVACICPKRLGDAYPEIRQAWPDSLKKEIVYSEPVIRNLLRKVWDSTVPCDLNLPCQQWWLDRCISRFSKEGKGITRDRFYGIFVSQDELYRISMQKLDSKFLSNILTDPNDTQSNSYEEFFLIAHVSQTDLSRELDKKVFMYAFPLWFAAHDPSPVY